MKNKLLSTFFLIICLTVSSCMDNNNGQAKKLLKSQSQKSSGSNANNVSSALASDGTEAVDETVLLSSKVELTHFVDPIDGTYKKKVSLPRNFRGYFYIAGLNVSAVSHKILKVRFNIGKDRDPITLNATVGRAPGIIPNSEIQVIIVDMSQRPFLRTRLPYDLYDYNSYSGSQTEDFVINNRDGGLYCRGLLNEDDPTFVGTDLNPTCSGTNSICKYSYAKVLDSTFLDVNNGNVAYAPTRMNAFTGSGYSYSQQLFKTMCLPDTTDLNQVKYLFNNNALTSVGVPFLAYVNPSDPSMGSSNFIYNGPFRLVNKSLWEISDQAITGANAGLFENCTGDYCTGSYLFPRQGKLDSTSGFKAVYGSLERFDARTFFSPSSSVTPISSIFVDGCNLRAQSYNGTTGLGMGSCNVSASIEFFYVENGKEYLITKDKILKLQLVRDSLLNAEGKEVLASSFKSCQGDSSMCGSNECCFNSRCWSKDLVSQCLDNLPGTGNLPSGDSCSTDFECGSLCCNQSTRTCSPHNTSGINPILCSKPPGASCVSRDYCRKEFVSTCKVYRDPELSPTGKPKCNVRCISVETYGTCTAGTCVPPAAPPAAADPDDPEVCAQAPLFTQ